MNRNEFLKNLGFGTVALIAGESLLSSCMGGMDMGESVAPIVSDGEHGQAGDRGLLPR